MNNGAKAPANATKNGKDTTPTSKPNLTVVKDEPKATTTVETPKVEQTKTPTVQEQRERQKKLNALFEKEAKLQESKDRLTNFILSTDESNNHLTLKDGRGAEFKTGNPEAIRKVIDLLTTEATEKIAEVQAQIIAA